MQTIQKIRKAQTAIICISIHYCCVHMRSWAIRKQLVVLILHMGAIKPLQKRVQRD